MTNAKLRLSPRPGRRKCWCERFIARSCHRSRAAAFRKAPRSLSTCSPIPARATLPEQVASIRSFLKYVGRPKRFTVVSDGTLSGRSSDILKSLDPVISVSGSAQWLPKDLPAKIYPYLTTHPTGKQLALIMSLPVDGPTLYVDSDVLFFPGASGSRSARWKAAARRPSIWPTAGFRLTNASSAATQRKTHPVNTGVLLLFEKLDWTLAVRRFLELQGSPDFFTNQTMTHLTMHANGALPFDDAEVRSAVGRSVCLPGSLRLSRPGAASLRQSCAAQVLDNARPADPLMMEPHDNPLRILVVVNLPWDSRLGAVRIYMELAEQWRASGHVVEKYSLSDAFPDARASSARFAIRQLLFPYKAAAFVRKNSARFDVVDALIGVLPFSKRRARIPRFARRAFGRFVPALRAIRPERREAMARPAERQVSWANFLCAHAAAVAPRFRQSGPSCRPDQPSE